MAERTAKFERRQADRPPRGGAARLSRRGVLALALAGLVGLPAAGRAAGSRPPADLVAGEIGTGRSVEAGDRLTLESGLKVRLAGIQSPEPGAPPDAAWPLADAGIEATRQLTAGHRLALHYGADRRDRWGYALAHVSRVDNDLWLQDAIVASGLARVLTTPSTAAGAPTLLASERAARAAGLGIWGNGFYRIRNPSETWDDLDSVQIVEGRVVAAAEVRGTVYLNFARDWRRDFTFRIRPPARRLFRRRERDPLRLNGRAVRGRGWVSLRNGPMIDLTHPEQLEVLPD